MKNLPKVTRIEIIDYSKESPRVYSKWDKDIKVQTELQDDGKTLKIFISKYKYAFEENEYKESQTTNDT